MNSCIKMFGGKNTMANKIIEYFPCDYKNMNYIEPFCGSAAILFHKEPSSIEVINDLNKNIYSLFKVIIDKDMFNIFKNKCDLTLYSQDLYKEYKKDLKDPNIDIIDRAYKFYYINRTSYNGLGGFSTSNVIRRNMSKSVSDYLSSIDSLYDIHNRLSKVIVYNDDALNIIKKYDIENTFMYCDSPYANETRTGGRYDVDMTDEQQDKYLETLLSIKKAKMIVSGYKCDRYSILEINGWKRIDIEINTQTTNRNKKTKLE